jgi:N utilization substance protein A
LFEQEIPELNDGVIAIKSISREPGYRSKVAVSSEDQQIDPISVCVGYRGSRIKAVREELAGEHIDVVRYDSDPEVLIPNALQPAEVDQVLLCDMIGRAIVLVQEDQLSLAIGRRGQNVRLASKLCGWDIEIMTNSELEEQIERAVGGFSQIPGITEEIAQALVEQGYLSYDDLSVIEPDLFMEMSGLSEADVDRIVETAEAKAEEAEQAAAEERRVRRDQERTDQNAPAPAKAETPVAEASTEEATAETAEAENAEAAEGDQPAAEVATETPETTSTEEAPAEPADEVSGPVAEEGQTESEEPEPVAEAVESTEADGNKQEG